LLTSLLPGQVILLAPYLPYLIFSFQNKTTNPLISNISESAEHTRDKTDKNLEALLLHKTIPKQEMILIIHLIYQDPPIISENPSGNVTSIKYSVKYPITQSSGRNIYFSPFVYSQGHQADVPHKKLKRRFSNFTKLVFIYFFFTELRPN
jgi:hypothetical protein